MARPEKKAKDLKEFDTELKELHMSGQWQYEELLAHAIGGPEPRGDAYLWPWSMVYPKLLEACEALPESETARRSLLFENPGLPNHGTTHTLLMGIQMIRPGEHAWAHRHTMAAIRFVIEGDGGVFTTVDGEMCAMEQYDLILTPKWTWHDHRNATAKHTIWLDALDVPLILALNQPFYEPYPGNRLQALKPNEGEYFQQRAGALRPAWEQRKSVDLPLRYRWKDTEAALTALAQSAGSPYDGIALEYVNPVAGTSTLPTLGCWIQMLRPGERTKKHRHTSSAMYFVVRGEGRTIVGEKTLEWKRHDSFVVPNWAWHEHGNESKSDDAILFCVNDIPVLSAFGLYREEPENSLGTAAAPAVPPVRPINS
ncbi:MAG TPA: cupin domain-containing protein [Verrucomicrobiae bacterium]|nr:cupin domain-containing protein [Verrucomicrobiae bacterium]